MPDKSLRFAFFGNEYQAKKSATMQKMVDLLRQHGAQICIDRPYYVFLTKVLHLDIDMTDGKRNRIQFLTIHINTQHRMRIHLVIASINGRNSKLQFGRIDISKKAKPTYIDANNGDILCSNA